MLQSAPFLIVKFPAPVSTTPPLCVIVPSSTVTDAAVCVPLTVTVYAAVASVPAEKIASPPAVQAAVAAVPEEEPLQKLLLPQVPVAVIPAPATVPLPSQYKLAAVAALMNPRTGVATATAARSG